MRGMDLEVDRERGDHPAKALRADAEAVNRVEPLVLELAQVVTRVPRGQRAENRLLGEERRLFEGSPDAHADDDWRTGIGARSIHRVDDDLADAGDAVRRK